MERGKNKIHLFGDKRHRETRLRRSVVSIDDTDFLMEVRSARRRSIETMANDDIGISAISPANFRRAWNDFSISPDNIRNIFPLNRSQNEARQAEEELLKETIPDLLPGTKTDQTDSVEDESSSSKKPIQSELSSPLPKPPSSVPATSNSEATESPHPAWYNRIAGLARRERQQEKDYHDTLDDHHKAKEENAFRRNQNHLYFRNWQRRSSRDGLDFSRDVALALRHDSIYAMADSVTFLPSFDDFAMETDTSEETEKMDNGYIQDTRPAANPKTTKSVLDLIA